MFGRSVTLFRVFGFAVRVDLSWIVIAVLVVWSLAGTVFPAGAAGLSGTQYLVMGVAGALGLFLSIVFHELSHSLVAGKVGLEMRGITLFIFGGVAEMDDEPPDARAEFLMAAAGPLASIVLAILFGAAALLGGGPLDGAGRGPVRTVLIYLAQINLMLAVFNLIPADVGRPLGDIQPKVNVPGLTQLILEVIDTLDTREREVQDREGHWYSLRIRPYKTVDNKIQGAVVALVDIDAAKRSATLTEEARDFADAIVETVRDPIIILESDLRVKRASRSFYAMFQATPQETEGRFLYDLGNGQWNIPRLRVLLEEILPRDSIFDDFEVEHEFPRIGRKRMLLNARRIVRKDNNLEAILLAIEDLTERTTPP